MPLQLESMASKKGEQVPWLRWCLFQRLIKPSWLQMCVCVCVWCLFRCSSTCDIPLEQKRHPSASALVFQDVAHAIGVQSLQCTWALCISAAKNSHHHSWQLSKIPHLPFCLPKFWILCSNMKVSLTLTSSTSVLFGRTCQDNLRFCFVTHLDVFRELNLYLKIWGCKRCRSLQYLQ